MVAAIRTRIVKIGNSQGIRIPKVLLEQSGIHTEVEIEVQGDHLTIRTAPRLRTGWDEAFAAMAEQGDDALPDNGVMDNGVIDNGLMAEVEGTDWDQVEWDW
jgi:antitoxin MazE